MTIEETLQLGRFTSPPPPSTLYHYTSGDALLSIINSQRIRATHIRYLNDASEINWTLKMALEQFEARKVVASSQDQAESLAQLIAAICRRPALEDFFASFSENGDDLSQ